MLGQSEFERVGRILTEKFGIHVVFRGDQPKTDGNTIYLPPLPAKIDNPELLACLRGFLDHECGHIVGKSSFDMLVEYGTKHGRLGHGLLNALEDVRCNALMSDLWAGCEVNLRIGNEHIDKQWADPKYRYESGAAQSALAHVMYGVSEAALGKPMPDWMDPRIAKVCEKRSAEVKAAVDKAKSTEDLRGVADLLVQDFRDLAEQQQQQDQQQSSSGDSGDGDGDECDAESDGNDSSDNSNSGGKGKVVKAKRSDNKDNSKAGGGNTEGDEDDKSDKEDGDGGKDADEQDDGDGNDEKEGGEKAKNETANLDDLDGGKEMDYGKELASQIDEKLNCHNQGDRRWRLYDPEQQLIWRDVHSSDKAVRDFIERNANYWATFSKKCDRAGGVIRQRLQQILQSEAKLWYRGGLKKGDPNPQDIARLSAGVSDRVMRRRFQRPAPNTACFLLVDGSGSMRMDGYSRDGETKRQVALAAADAFVGVLGLGGHSSCVTVFTTTTNSLGMSDDRCRHCESFLRDTGLIGSMGNPHAKLYHEQGGAQCKGIVTTITEMARLKRWGEVGRIPTQEVLCHNSRSHGANTPLGEALLAASMDLIKRPEKRKVLMIFSDGQPQNLEFTNQVLDEIAKTEIETVAIGILDGCVRRLHCPHTIINDLDDLATTCMQELSVKLGLGTSQR